MIVIRRLSGTLKGLGQLVAVIALIFQSGGRVISSMGSQELVLIEVI